jgi:hypothetical protein
VLATPPAEAVRIAGAMLTTAEREALLGIRHHAALALAVALRRPLGPHAELVRVPAAERSPLATALLEPGAGGGRAPDGRGLAVLRATGAWSAAAAGLPTRPSRRSCSTLGADPARLRSAALLPRAEAAACAPRFDVGHYRTIARLERSGLAPPRGAARHLAGDYLVDRPAGAVALGPARSKAVTADLA